MMEKTYLKETTYAGVLQKILDNYGKHHFNLKDTAIALDNAEKYPYIIVDIGESSIHWCLKGDLIGKLCKLDDSQKFDWGDGIGNKCYSAGHFKLQSGETYYCCAVILQPTKGEDYGKE